MKRGDASFDDCKILFDYVHGYAYKKAIEKGLSPVDAITDVADKAWDRFTEAIVCGEPSF